MAAGATPSPLHIDLWSTRERAQRVAIHSQRPVHAARIFSRRPVDEVLTLLPRLFSVCGIAQGQAAHAALARATGREPDAQAHDAALLLVEIAREHLWRVLVDWPAFLSDTFDRRTVRAMQSLVPAVRERAGEPEAAAAHGAQFLNGLLHDAVFGQPAADWLALADRDAVAAWCRDADTTAARLVRHVIELGWERIGGTTPHCLPRMGIDTLDARLACADADDFVERPDWQGLACETTPLARGRSLPLVASLERDLGAGLLTRIVALLAELADLPRRLAAVSAGADRAAGAGVQSDAMPGNVGIAQVDAARGRLVHRVVVDGDSVERYQIVAPTEWNFHPRGVLATSLASLDAGDVERCRQQAELLAMTIDPCVEFSVRVH